MKKLSRLIALGLLFLLAACGVVSVGKSSSQIRTKNLGFEEGSPGLGMPTAWGHGNGDYSAFELAVDDEIKRSGKQAFRIRSIAESSSFAGANQCVETPAEAKELRYSGFLRTESVSGSGQDTDSTGSALWVGVEDPLDGKEVSFDNLHNRWEPGEPRQIDNRRVCGTTGWAPKSLRLIVPPEAGRSCFGVFLASTGTLWADDLKLEYTSSD